MNDLNLLVFHKELTEDRRRNNPVVEFIHRNQLKKFEGREGKERVKRGQSMI